MSYRLARFAKIAAALLALSLQSAHAQSYPTKPIRIIITGMAGTADNIIRVIAPRLSERLGQPVIIDARPGASHQLAAMTAKRADPDGYTLLQSTYTMHVSNPVQLASIQYDPDKDFAHITSTMRSAVVLATSASVPATTIPELVALSKKTSGGLAYGGGIGTAQDQMMISMITGSTGMALLNVPYKSISPMMPDILSGRIQIASLPPALIMQSVAGGKLRAIATLDNQRSEIMPNVPTMAELGYPPVVYRYWFGLSAPAGTPDEIIRRLHREVTEILNEPAIKEFARTRGLRIEASASPGAFNAMILSDRAAEEKAAKAVGIYKSGTGS